jgi:cytidylate kinase
MSVITISRGAFSGGDMLAECLSGELGYRCVDREVIVERAAAHGVSQEVLRDALQKPPTLLERIQHTKYLYLVLIQAALIEEVRAGAVVYHGNAGHLLLKGGPRILRVRIVAPIEFRLEMARDRLKFSREEALEYLAKADQDRIRWTQYLYGIDWGDPANYDVVLNLESTDIPGACQTVAALARERSFDLSPAWHAAMDELALASSVRTELALNERTSHMEFEVAATGRAVRIAGSASGMWEVEQVRQVAAAAPGVESVNLDEVNSPARP